MRTLVINAGSSSTKVSVLEGNNTLFAKSLPPAADTSVMDTITELVNRFRPEATGHRIVHGGPKYVAPLLVTREMDAELARLAELAPLHNPPALSLLNTVMQHYPAIPAVACFDTTFFASLPHYSATYAIPDEWREHWNIRRYGFHGLSHSWASRQGAKLIGRPLNSLRIVTAHLGSGASLAAIAYGTVVDTTMGFTPLEGLIMGTRSGTLDPGILTFIMRNEHLSPNKLEDILEHQSGLTALAGTADLHNVIQRYQQGDERATRAWKVYLHRLQTSIGSMVVACGGIDLLVFTGGAGERSALLRNETCEGLNFLGLSIDPELNDLTEPSSYSGFIPQKDISDTSDEGHEKVTIEGATMHEGTIIEGTIISATPLATSLENSPKHPLSSVSSESMSSESVSSEASPDFRRTGGLPAVAVVHAREDIEIAQQVELVLK